MGQGISAILTFAIGVAISPVPIIAVILMLFSQRARVNGPAFLAGWVLALAALSTIVYVVSHDGNVATSSTASDSVSWGKIVLGVALLALARRNWRKRPAPGKEAEMPKWLASVESVSPLKAFGLAVLLAAVNPKNLILIIGGGLAIAQATHETVTQEIIAGAIFTVLAASTVVLPVVAYNVAREPATKMLVTLRDWLSTHANAVLGTVFALLGVLLIGKGIGGF